MPKENFFHSFVHLPVCVCVWVFYRIDIIFFYNYINSWNRFLVSFLHLFSAFCFTFFSRSFVLVRLKKLKKREEEVSIRMYMWCKDVFVKAAEKKAKERKKS